MRDGVVESLDAGGVAGRVVDAGGRLVVPGLHDGHCHPHVPFTLVSPGAPALLSAGTVTDLLDEVRAYVEAHPEDRYPRMFGWMSSAFGPGEAPRRELLDGVVRDRPAYLVHHSGHEFWANTRALELAGVLEADPDGLASTAEVERDPATGLATGALAESEYSGTDGVLLRGVREVGGVNGARQAEALRQVLDEFPKYGVTSIWTKDGYPELSLVYADLLAGDGLAVRAMLDHLYTPCSIPERFAAFAACAHEIAACGLPEGFLRADGVTLLCDLVARTHGAWMSEPYGDGAGDGGSGAPVFPPEEFRRQVAEAAAAGLSISILALGDRAVHESLDALEAVSAANPPRRRRHAIEHAQYVRPEDFPRFGSLDVSAVMNPISAYPAPGRVEALLAKVGAARLERLYQPWSGLVAAGVTVVSGSDFPFGPLDPFLGMHVLVNGTDLAGEAEGGLWPRKRLAMEDALRTCTTAAAYARGEENRLGRLLPGFAGDLVVLSEDVLAEGYDTGRLPWVKSLCTVLNGHVVHEDDDTAKVVSLDA